MILLLIAACITYSTYAADNTLLRNSRSHDLGMSERTDLKNINDIQCLGDEGPLAILGRSVQLVASCMCLTGVLGVLYLEECAVGITHTVLSSCDRCAGSAHITQETLYEKNKKRK